MKVLTVSYLLVLVCINSFYKSKPVATCWVATGEQFVYSYTGEGIGYSDIQMLYNTDSSIKAQAFFQRQSLQAMQVNIRCKIKKTIIASNGDSMKVCFEIIQPDVKIKSGALPVDAGMIVKEMVIPIFAKMSVTGSILAVKIDTAVSQATAGIVKNILSNTQAVIISDTKKSWQIMEENTVGLFKANYKVVHKSANSIEYLKTNSGYEKIKSGKKDQKFIPDSKATIITDTHGMVQRISTSESLVTMFGADTIVASGSSTEYKLLSASTISHTALRAFEKLQQSGSYLEEVSLSAPPSDEEINRLAYKNTLANDNFKSLMAKLGLVKIQDNQFESDLVKKFRALAWLSEPDCIKMATLLKNATPGSDTFRIMSNALAVVETPFSINELANVIALRKNDELVMIELLPVLATTKTPTGKAADIIKGLAFSKTENVFITSTAQLTLGGMVKNLAPIDKKKADELTDIIIENMKNSTDTLQQLLVYGNTASYRLLPIISSYISDTMVSPEMRKAAVFAMRLIDNKVVTSLLGKLAVDKDTVISKAANETIEFRREYLKREK
ncbi:MAG: hypothetical protein JSU03_08265 [Bacteroidetes bacterium]|nr:hypothetical protein [Bacteroidota bacterium]MBS1757257.1 hypothetical protein [Bacteroidota bacterium]